MPNTSPQAIVVSNEKMRPLADKFGQLYNLCKALAAESGAENWAAMFPNDAQQIMDNSDTDGRTILTNADIFNLMAIVGTFLTYIEQASNANRNVVLKVASNPQRF